MWFASIFLFVRFLLYFILEIGLGIDLYKIRVILLLYIWGGKIIACAGWRRGDILSLASCTLAGKGVEKVFAFYHQTSGFTIRKNVARWKIYGCESLEMSHVNGICRPSTIKQKILLYTARRCVRKWIEGGNFTVI